MYVDFGEIIQGLVETGMPPVRIASKLGVSRSTICRWRQGECNPRGHNMLDLLDLAEQWTDKRQRALRNRNAA